MRRTVYVILPLSLIAATVLGFNLKQSRWSQGREAVAKLGIIDQHVSARGRVVGISEEIRLGSRMPGRIKSILVEEGERVELNQVLAVLENGDFLARLEMEKAGLRKAQSHLELVINGARREERQTARSSVNEAQAIAENARTTFQRLNNLYGHGLISKDQLDQAEKGLKTADAELESASQRYGLIMSPARFEDVESARAEVDVSRARLREAQVNYENTFIKSPINGIVLKKYMRLGEVITSQSLPMPLLSLADNSRILIRAEVDETDVSQVAIGQQAFATADAYRNQTFAGKVVSLSGSLGKTQIKTDNPTERVDTEVLEALIKLEPGAEKRLKLGLRVDVMIRIVYKENVLVLPVQAVSKLGKESYVQLKNGRGSTEHKVIVGTQDHALVEIKGGLNVNDLVRY